MAWNLKGSYFENCNCEVMCPCGASFFALPADNERCLVVLAFHIDSGDVDGVDVSGLNYAIVADAPGMMIEGNWRVGVVMDAAATPEQAKALGPVISGERGGAPAGFAPLIGEVMGVETAPIEFTSSGNRHSVKIGGIADIEVEDFVPEGQTEPIQITNVPHPVATTLAIGRGTRSSFKAFGLDIDNTGKNAHSAPFSWAA